MIKEKSYAKINLGLNITKIKKDGYHDLEMVMVPINLYDTVTMFRSENYCLISNVELPENNTIFQTVELARNEFQLKDQFTIVLEKEIPFQSGLGGASANAASILRMIREMYSLNVSDQELIDLGKRIGGDVPFCVLDQCAVVKGMGEVVEPFTFKGKYYALLVKPKQGVSTMVAYHHYDEVGGDHPNIKKLVEALKAGDEEKIASTMGNSLEKAAFQMNRQIEPIKMELKSLGLPMSMMSGSGATVFGMSKDLNLCEDLESRLKNRYEFVKCVKVFNEGSK